MDSYINVMKKQFPEKPGVDDEGNPIPVEDPAPVGVVPDLLADSQMYQWAGIGFGQQEMYRL